MVSPRAAAPPSDQLLCVLSPLSVRFPSRKKTLSRARYLSVPFKCLSTSLPLSPPCSCMERAQQCFHNKHCRSFLRSAFSHLSARSQMLLSSVSILRSLTLTLFLKKKYWIILLNVFPQSEVDYTQCVSSHILLK